MLNKLKSTVTGFIPGNPVQREFEITCHRASGGPGLLWKIYDGFKKTTKQVHLLSSLLIAAFTQWQCPPGGRVGWGLFARTRMCPLKFLCKSHSIHVQSPQWLAVVLSDGQNTKRVTCAYTHICVHIYRYMHVCAYMCGIYIYAYDICICIWCICIWCAYTKTRFCEITRYST